MLVDPSDSYFEGLVCLKARGNNADLRALIDHLATQYLIVHRRFQSPLALELHVAPATEGNREELKLKAVTFTRRKRVTVLVNYR